MFVIIPKNSPPIICSSIELLLSHTKRLHLEKTQYDVYSMKLIYAGDSEE